MNPVTYVIKNQQQQQQQQQQQNACGLSGNIWAKSGPMLWKNKETGIINELFS